MTKELFLTLTIGAQIILLSFDLLDKYLNCNNTHKAEKFKLRSIIFLIFIVFIYGIIQFAGLSLIPSIEYLVSTTGSLTSTFELFHYSQQSLSILGWIILCTLTFYISGFWDYIIHRFMSHNKTLFFTHEYHHLPNELFLALPGLSVRPFVVIALFPATLGTLLTLFFGLSIIGHSSLQLMSLIYTIIFIQTVILAGTHSSFLIKQRWIHNIFKFLAITTPQEHEIHHTIDIRGNYGNFTILWDRLLETYVDPTKIENQNHKLGLSYDQDFLGALTAGKFKFSKKFREYFQIDRYCNID